MSDAAIADVLPVVIRMLERMRSLPRPDELELELRFGVMTPDGRFKPGVTRELMETVIGRLQTNAACAVGEWTEHEDYFYQATVGGVSRKVRTRVQYDADEFGIERTHTLKKRLAHTTLRAGDAALRIALSRETPVHAKDIPTCASTSHVRIQQRKTIRWSRVPASSPPWSYEFSLTWAGETRSKAESLRAGGAAAVHEFEIELDLQSDYTRRHADEYMARSLLMKAADFMEPHALFTLVSEASEGDAE